MKKVIIEEFFNFKETGLHGTVSPDKNDHIQTGELIQDQNGDVYTVTAIGFPCSIKAKDFLLRLKKNQINC